MESSSYTEVKMTGPEEKKKSWRTWRKALRKLTKGEEEEENCLRMARQNSPSGTREGEQKKCWMEKYIENENHDYK